MPTVLKPQKNVKHIQLGGIRVRANTSFFASTTQKYGIHIRITKNRRVVRKNSIELQELKNSKRQSGISVCFDCGAIW